MPDPRAARYARLRAHLVGKADTDPLDDDSGATVGDLRQTIDEAEKVVMVERLR